VAADGHPLAAGAFGEPGACGFEAVIGLADGSTLAGGTAGRKGWLVRASGGLHLESASVLDDVIEVHDLAQLANGSVAVVASQDRSTTNLAMTSIVALEDDWRVVWQMRLPATGRGEATSVAALSNGGLVAVGQRSTDGRERAQLWLVALDATGEVVYERRIGEQDEEWRGRDIVSLAAGGVAVAADVLREGQRELRAARFDERGTPVWERTYTDGGHTYSEARGLARTADDGLVVVGSTLLPAETKTRIRILRVDDAGRRLWDRVFDAAR
jgi:hypothetical protein